MKLLTALLLLSGSIVITAASAEITEVGETKVIGVEAADLYRSRHVLRRFFSREKHPECYRVLFSDFQGNLAVEFIPKDQDPIIYNEEDEPPVAGTPCGRNVGYVLDRRGAILRRLYSR